MKKIDINKKYKTRDGRDVLIVCAMHELDTKSNVLGYVKNDEGKFESFEWKSNGKFSVNFDSNLDLIEVEDEVNLILQVSYLNVETDEIYISSQDIVTKPISFLDNFKKVEYCENQSCQGEYCSCNNENEYSVYKEYSIMCRKLSVVPLSINMDWYKHYEKITRII